MRYAASDQVHISPSLKGTWMSGVAAFLAPALPPLALHSSRGVTARVAALIRLLVSAGEMTPLAAAAAGRGAAR